MTISRKKIENIILDYSGTLINDIHRTWVCAYEVLVRLDAIHKQEELTLETFRKEFELPPIKFYRKFTKAPEEQINAFYTEALEDYSKRSEKPKLFEGTAEALERIQQAYKNLYIISSHPQERLNAELEEYDIKIFFDQIKGGVKDKKIAILKLVANHQLSAKLTVYIGDMPEDIYAGNGAGVQTIGITEGWGDVESLMKANPSIGLITNLSKIFNLIEI